MTDTSSQRPASTPRREGVFAASIRFGRGEWAAIVAILIAAWVLRVVAFNEVPPGIIHDEVRNYFNAQLVMAGDIRALYPHGGGREALYIFIEAISYALLGTNVLAARFPSLAFGMISVAASFALARRLFGRVAGFVAAAGIATSFWALMFSRLAVRTGSMPALSLLAAHLYLRLLGVQRPGVGQVIAAGTVLGLTLYTYPTALIFPVVVVAWVVAIRLFCNDPAPEALPGSPNQGRWSWQPIAASFAVAVLIAIPLVLAWANPANTARADEVNAPLEALLAGDPGPALANLGPVLGVFSVAGDHGLEFNVQDQPVFPTPLLALLFYAGIVATGMTLIRGGPWRGGAALIALWLLAMLVPTLVTERPVNPSRTIGLLGVVYIFPALAAAWIFRLARGRAAWLAPLVGMVIAAALIWQMIHTARGYFVTWAMNPVVEFLYQDEYRQLAADLGAQPPGVPLAVGGLTPEVDAASLLLLAHNDSLAGDTRFFDPQNALVLPFGGEAREAQIIIPESISVHPALADKFIQWRFSETNRDGYAAFAAHAGRALPPSVSQTVEFHGRRGAAAVLVSVETLAQATPGESYTVLTYWVVRQPPGESLRIFFHVRGPDGLLAQSDILGVPASQWRPGDLIIQAHDLTLPPDTPDGPYEVHIGLYNPETGTRLRIGGSQGRDAVRILMATGD